MLLLFCLRCCCCFFRLPSSVMIDGCDGNPGSTIAVDLVLRYTPITQALSYSHPYHTSPSVTFSLTYINLHHSPSNTYPHNPFLSHAISESSFHPCFTSSNPLPFHSFFHFISFHSGSPSKPVAATNWRQPCRSINQKINQSIALACHIHADTNPTHAKSHTQTHIQ